MYKSILQPNTFGNQLADFGYNWYTILSENPLALSGRAIENIVKNVQGRGLKKALATPYDKDEHPDGHINLGMADSSLMHEELVDHLKSNFDIIPHSHLTYGYGPNGSPRLLKAVASFLSSLFHPIRTIAEEELIITSGAASSIDALTWCICDDGILVTQPLYPGFLTNIEMRSRGRLLPVSFVYEDHDYCVDDVFDVQANRRVLERALKQYIEEGIKVRAVLITNPHNPLGKCYTVFSKPVDTLNEIARFCSRHNLHLISDEVYANSTFINPFFPEATRFRSILSIDMEGIMDTKLIHVIYGMSKDFCANGLRLGVLQTRNNDLHEAASSINVFSWSSYATQDQWARVLEDEKFLDRFISINQVRLANSYTRFALFLEKHGIPYLKGGNAGFFFWVHLLRSDTGNNQSPSKMKAKLINTCFKNGVFIRDGSDYFAEEKEDGWFRITFTVDEQTLDVAMERLMRTLREINNPVSVA